MCPTGSIGDLLCASVPCLCCLQVSAVVLLPRGTWGAQTATITLDPEKVRISRSARNSLCHRPADFSLCARPVIWKKRCAPRASVSVFHSFTPQRGESLSPCSSTHNELRAEVRVESNQTTSGPNCSSRAAGVGIGINKVLRGSGVQYALERKGTFGEKLGSTVCRKFLRCRMSPDVPWLKSLATSRPAPLLLTVHIPCSSG